MAKNSITLALLLTGIFALSRALSRGESALAAEDKTAVDRSMIEGTFKSIGAAWEARDAKALSENFVEDADFTNVRGTHVHGRKAIEEMHAALFNGIFKNSHVPNANGKQNLSIRFLRDDIAAVDAHGEMTGASLPDGTIIPERHLLINAVLEKRNGAWLIVVLHNMDLPLAKTTDNATTRP
jgi:uncharacterized protein (TIGR02246 family)